MTDEAQQRIGEPYQQAKAAINRLVRERDTLLAQRDALLAALQVAAPHLLRDDYQSEQSIRSAAMAIGKRYEDTLHYAGRKARAAIASAEEASDAP